MRQRARGAHCAPLPPFTDERLRSLGLNERQRRAVAYVREHGKITNTEYQRMEGISERTATRDFTALVQQGILVPSGTKGRGVTYSLKTPESRQSRQKAAKRAIVRFRGNLMGQSVQASLLPTTQTSRQGPWKLPSGWEWVPLGEMCETIVGGGTPDRGNPRYWGGPIPWASVKDLKSDELTFTQESITPEGLENSAARLVEPETIVVATRMGLGKVCVARTRVAINQDLKGLVLRSNILPQYVVFFLKSRASDIEGRGSGATVKGIKLEELKAWPVSIPFPRSPARSLDTQRQIVSRIEALLAEVKEAHALAAAIRRDTDRIMDAALEEVISELPASRRPLLEVLERKPRNGWSPQCDNDPAGTLVLKLGAVLGFRFNPLAVKHTSLPADPRAHYWLTKDDILISRSNTPDLVGHAAVYPGEPYPCVYPDLLMRMRVQPLEADPQFVIYWLQGKEARVYIRTHAAGASSTMKKITQGDVCSLPFPKITVEEQRRVTAYLDAVQAEVDEMRRLQAQDAEFLDQLEQSILERAFRGEL